MLGFDATINAPWQSQSYLFKWALTPGLRFANFARGFIIIEAFEIFITTRECCRYAHTLRARQTVDHDAHCIEVAVATTHNSGHGWSVKQTQCLPKLSS